MDRKAIIVIICSIAALLFWPTIFQKLYPAKPLPPGAAQVTNANGVVTTTSTTASATLPAAVSNLRTNLPLPTAKPAGPEEILVLSNAVARYSFTSHGGALRSMELLAYPQSVDCASGRRNAAGRSGSSHASLNTDAPVSALSLQGDGYSSDPSPYTLTRTATGVRAEKLLPNGLVSVNEFDIGSNYVFKARVRLENRTTSPIVAPAHEINAGTATPRELVYDTTKVGFYWGRGSSVEHITSAWFINATLGCFPGTPRTFYQDGASNVTWSAVHNQFFSLAVIPSTPANQIVAQELTLPPPSIQDLQEHPSAVLKPVGYQAGLIYPAVTVPAGQAYERDFTLYAGPKEYNTLARLGASLKLDLDQIVGFDQVLFGSFSGFFGKILLLALNGIHKLGISYGMTIVVITILIKLLFWPLTAASTKSMKRMQELQPQMKALQDKYKDDPAKLNRKMMEFWKEHKVNPFGGCLPILLQMPVFIGFFAMIQTAIELRGASFLWACDLTKPDTVLHLAGFPLNPMPLLMGVTMIWQARIQPMAPGMDPMQAKLMKYMPLMFLVMLYNFSSGLTLYWTVQNLLSILQMKLTHVKDEKAEAAKASSASAGKKAKS